MATTDTSDAPAPDVAGGAGSAARHGTAGKARSGGVPAGESAGRRYGTLIEDAQLAAGGRPVRRIRWWWEVLLAVLGYYVYSQARDLHGNSAVAQRAIAKRHGKELFDFEKTIGLDWEKGLQHFLLPYKGFMQAVGGFYGGAHFAVTIGLLLWMLFKRPQFYRFWRTALFVLTMTAVGIFALYPAMPPRTLKDASGHTITVDTLSKIGGLWSYNHGTIEHISDPFAPMPSLHLGWATWVAFGLWYTLPAQSWRRRAVAVLYPVAVYFTVIATGTHFVIDGVAGMALTAVVVTVCALVARTYRRRKGERLGQSGAPRRTELT